MSPIIDILRKQLLFRSWHRGTREADLVFGRFADRHLGGLDERQLADYARLLDEEDPDLWDWLTGQAPVPDRHRTPVLALLRHFHNMSGNA